MATRSSAFTFSSTGASGKCACASEHPCAPTASTCSTPFWLRHTHRIHPAPGPAAWPSEWRCSCFLGGGGGGGGRGRRRSADNEGRRRSRHRRRSCYGVVLASPDAPPAALITHRSKPASRMSDEYPTACQERWRARQSVREPGVTASGTGHSARAPGRSVAAASSASCSPATPELPRPPERLLPRAIAIAAIVQWQGRSQQGPGLQEQGGAVRALQLGMVGVPRRQLLPPTEGCS